MKWKPKVERTAWRRMKGRERSGLRLSKREGKKKRRQAAGVATRKVEGSQTAHRRNLSLSFVCASIASPPHLDTEERCVCDAWARKCERTSKQGATAQRFLTASQLLHRCRWRHHRRHSESFFLPSSTSFPTLLAKTIPEAETIFIIAYAADRALLVEPTAMVVVVAFGWESESKNKKNQKLDSRICSSVVFFALSGVLSDARVSRLYERHSVRAEQTNEERERELPLDGEARRGAKTSREGPAILEKRKERRELPAGRVHRFSFQFPKQ